MNAPGTHASQRPLRALVLRAGSAIAFATMMALTKYGGQNGVSVPELMFWCQFLSVPVLLVYLSATGGVHRLRSRRRGRHIVRGSLGTFNTFLNFTATIMLPLAVMSTLTFTTPLFAVVLAAVVLREHIGPYRWAAVVMGFLGTLIIAQPSGNHEPLPMLGLAMGLLVAFLNAVITLQVRDLGRTEETISMVFWFALLGSVLTAPALIFSSAPHPPWIWFVIFMTGVMWLLGQMLMAASLRHGSVALVVVMDYTLLIWATIWGWVLWDKLPPGSTYLGAPLIVAAGLTIAWRERRRSGVSAEPVDAPAS